MLMALELSRLDALYQVASEALDGAHYLTSAGKVIEHNGAELADSGPVLRAIDRLLRISGRRCALMGLDAPKQDTGEAAEIAEALKEFAARVPLQWWGAFPGYKKRGAQSETHGSETPERFKHFGTAYKKRHGIPGAQRVGVNTPDTWGYLLGYAQNFRLNQSL